jgi:hypothetical protein
MIATNSRISHIDQEAVRRQALAKVYMLLLRLAEEAENKTTTSDATVTDGEKLEEPLSAE